MSDLSGVSGWGRLCVLFLSSYLWVMAMDVVIGDTLRFFCLLWLIADVVDLLINCKWVSASVPTDGSERRKTKVVVCPSPLTIERSVAY